MPRTLYIIWPGNHEGQRAVWAWLQLSGLSSSVKFIHQADAFLEGRENFPDRIDLGSFDAARAARQSLNRDWYPFPPTLAMPDYEADGDNQSSMWQGWIQKYPDSWVRFWDHFTRGVRNATGLPCGAYGIPIVGKDPVPFAPNGAFSVDRWRAARRIVDSHDWVFLGLYPPSGIVPPNWMEDEEGHAERAATNYNAAQLVYMRPVIPALWARWGMDAEAYARVYCRTLATAGANSLAVWINPHSQAMTRVYIRALTRMLPFLKEFVEG